MNTAWKQRFDEETLAQGEKLFEASRVKNLTEDEYGYEAEVDGEDVTIYMDDDDELEDMECSCEDAEGGPCKHMAAVLFEIYEEESVAGTASLDEILLSMTEEQLREELREILANDEELEMRIINRYRSAPFSRHDLEELEERLEDLAYIHGDRGFIDWHQGYAYVSAFSDVLSDTVKPMIDRGQYMTAFNALGIAYEIANTVEMDGSNGEHDDLGYHIYEYWKDILSKASEAECDKMHDWFERNYNDMDIISDYISRILKEGFVQEKYLLPQLEDMRNKLQTATDSYSLASMLKRYKEILETLGMPLDEYHAWLDNHSTLRTVIDIFIKDARQANDTERLIGLYKEKMERYNSSDACDSLLKIAKNNHDEKHEKEYIKKLLFDFKSFAMDNIRRLKEMSEPDEWSSCFKDLLALFPSYKMALYEEEQMFDELVKALHDCEIDTVNRYRKMLADKYPEDFISMYEKHLRKLETRSPSASLYETMREFLMIIVSIPTGKERARKIIVEWNGKYPTRKAMRKMLATIPV